MTVCWCNDIVQSVTCLQYGCPVYLLCSAWHATVRTVEKKRKEKKRKEKKRKEKKRKEKKRKEKKRKEKTRKEKKRKEKKRKHYAFRRQFNEKPIIPGCPDVRTVCILPAGHSLSCCFSKAFKDYSHQVHLDSGATFDRSSRDQGVVGTAIKRGISVKV